MITVCKQAKHQHIHVATNYLTPKHLAVIYTWNTDLLRIINPGKMENHFMFVENMAIYLVAMAAEESLTRNHPPMTL
jgi:hypothetical protein